MKVCGIIAEYNPFHNGHRYQIEQARKQSGCDMVIAVMSGNFVQRGEPAIIDKWKRAKVAIENGIDLVIELPYFYATQSASKFAYGAVELLKMAKVDYISFGSECANLANLQEIADTSLNPDNLRESMQTGMSFPRAYSLLTGSMEPNDILAVSYLKYLKGSNIQPVIVQRTSSYLNPEISENASALAIRKALKNNERLASSTPMEEILKESTLVYPEQFYPYLRTYLLTSSRKQLEDLFLFNEGIENHLRKCAADNDTYEGFLQDATTYRYTSNRIRRSILQAMVQLTKYEAQRLPTLDHLRILAFNDTGKKWLHDMRKEDMRICSKFADVPFPWRTLEYRSTLLYTSVLPSEERKHLLKLEIRGAHYILSLIHI